MKKRSTIIDLIAYCFLKWKIVVVCMFAVGIVAGGIQGLKQIKTRESINGSIPAETVKYQTLNQAYTTEKKAIEAEIEILDAARVSAQKYLNESILMQLDPDSVAVCMIDFSLNLPNDEDYRTSVRYYNTPEEYAVTKVQNAYASMWNVFDAATLEGMDVYGVTNEKYIKEMVSIDILSGGILEITAVGSSEEYAQKLAEGVFEFILDSQNLVDASVNSHTITKISETTKTISDESLADTQQKKAYRIEDLTTSIEKLQDRMAALNAPASPSGYSWKTVIRNTVAYGLLGLVFGVLAGVVLIIIECVISNRLLHSSEISGCDETVWNGAVAEKRGLFERAADALSCERIWSVDESLKYVTSRIGYGMNQEKKTTMVMSTMDKKDVGIYVERLRDELKSKGEAVEVVYHAAQNGELYGTVRSCGTIIMVEKTGRTKMSLVAAVKDDLHNVGKELSGVIVIR